MKLCNCEQKIRDRFLAKVRKTDTCWLWLGSLSKKGYGVAYLPPKKPVRAHRLSYFLEYGSFDESLMVLHKCDVRACVRPDHLFLGNAMTNNKDMEKKGRAWFQTIDKDHTPVV
jgi:hypothetical protein